MPPKLFFNIDFLNLHKTKTAFFILEEGRPEIADNAFILCINNLCDAVFILFGSFEIAVKSRNLAC